MLTRAALTYPNLRLFASNAVRCAHVVQGLLWAVFASERGATILAQFERQDSLDTPDNLLLARHAKVPTIVRLRGIPDKEDV